MRPQQLRLSNECPTEAPKIEINNRCRVERQDLRKNQSADDRDAERLAKLRPGTAGKGQRERTEQCSHCCHRDRPEAQECGLVDRLLGLQSLPALGIKGKIDHHDRILFDDADQQDDPDKSDNREVLVKQRQSQQCADARRRQSRKDRYRVDIALVKDTENDVDGDYCCGDQKRLRLQRGLKRLRRS
jgi:hypothetical protein